MASKWKDKGILFSQTLKVWENKVPLVFSFGGLIEELRLFYSFLEPGNSVKLERNSHNSSNSTPNEKLRALYFPKYLRYDKI